MEILDSATLERFKTLEPPNMAQWLSFSPDSRLLARFGLTQEHTWELTNWDLQTGGLVSSIPTEPYSSPTRHFSSTHSMDGKAVAVAYGDADTTVTAISTYDISSGTHTHSHRISGGRIVASIWTHGGCVRFVTVKPGSITIWEVGFTSAHTPTEVESLPAPDEINCSGECLFLPTLSRLAFTFQGAALVWDARDSRVLLKSPDGDYPTKMSFSTDGRVFAYGTTHDKIYLWTELPTGYTLQRVIPSSDGFIGPLLSPNGESIIIPDNMTIQLLRVADPTPPAPSVTIESDEQTSFIVEFSPGRISAAAARLEESMVTVFDLKSGDPRLIIDASMKILGLRVTDSAVVVVGEGKVVTWNLPAENSVPATRANISDSVQTTMFDHSAPPNSDPRPVPCTSISPDLNRVAIAWDTLGKYDGLNIYDVSAGKCLTGTTTKGYMPWFTPDGSEVWCRSLGDSADGWTITEDTRSGLPTLRPLGSTARPSGGFPWRSPRGHKVAHDGWVLDSSRKRLLWLPHRWRSSDTYMTWSGRFLGLLHRELPEAVILEFDG